MNIVKKSLVLLMFLLLINSCNGLTLSEYLGFSNSQVVVHFDTNGGTVVDDQKVAKGSIVEEPEIPIRVDYTFKGWYSDESCIDVWDFSYDTVNEDQTLYADWGYNNTETFDDADRPELEYNTEDDYFFIKPWNYEKEYNEDRDYPLFIYLHGMSQDEYLKNLYYMGMGYYSSGSSTIDTSSIDTAIEYKPDVADEFHQTYPCFTFVPQESGKSWSTSELISMIEDLKSTYRIDTNRIYLHGFSMGGIAIYPLAKAYYEQYGQLFAAIIRLDGSGRTLDDEIVEKTSVWLMCGQYGYYLSDSRNAYNFLKEHSYNSSAEEYYLEYTTGTYHATNTKTLTKNGIVIARLTEFPGEDHYITSFPFGETSAEGYNVLEWMFNQSLALR